MKLSHWYKALALGVGALALRLLYVAVAGKHVGILAGTDAVSYDRFARLMMSGWHWITTPLAVREPLYPAFMALSYRLPGSEIGTLQLMQALAGALAVVIVYLTLRTMLQERMAVIAAALIALHPHFITYTAEPLRENLIIPLLAAALMLFLLALKNGGEGRWFLCALFFTLLIHTDVRFLPLMAAIPVMAFAWHRRAGLALGQAAWMWFLLAMLMVPYQARCYIAMGKPVIVTERFLGKWLDRAASVVSSNRGAGGDKRLAWLQEWEAKKRQDLDNVRPEEQAFFLSGGRPETDRLAVHRILFIEYWRFAQLKSMYRPYPDGRFEKPWSAKHTVASGIVMIPFLILLPFVFIGSSASSRRVVYPLMIYLASSSLMHVFVHARERYRIPMEIVTAVLVAVAAANLWRLVRREKPEPHVEREEAA
ncbi:MAG: glycosyltransferase family 39 protein [Chitinivibrionia bacterium]|nr:glycosyltransferase family 39 protein [Chitinivibrionia bacterium]